MIVLHGRNNQNWLLVQVASMGPIIIHPEWLLTEGGFESFCAMCDNSGVRLGTAG